MYIGIDHGASRLKIVVLGNGFEIKAAGSTNHHGDLQTSLKQLAAELGITGRPDAAGWTGAAAEKDSFNERLLHYSDNARSLLAGIRALFPKAGSVLDVGAQQCLFIDGLSEENVLTINSTSGCSAGTGSFFEEQMDRLGYTFEQLPGLLKPVDRIPRIAGRCSVFARTDIIHRQQEGYTPSELLHGLAMSVALSLSGTLLKGRAPDSPLVLAGGLVNNPGFLSSLNDIVGPGCKVITDEYSEYISAVGAAIEAADNVRSTRSPLLQTSEWSAGKQKNDPEPLSGFGKDDSSGKHSLPDFNGAPSSLTMGIDTGSTSINIALLDSRMEVVDFVYSPNLGDPEAVITRELGKLRSKYGFDKIKACVTGSGRRRIAARFDIEMLRDEITAQAAGAGNVYGDNALIFEIGGQDSKYIDYRNGSVADFRMNRICAAGTGAFLEEQAVQLGVDLETFVGLALSSKSPAVLDENCTVFMRSSVVSELKKGRNKADIAAGLCYAVVKNYLKRVAAGCSLNRKSIIVQGGIAYNQAVINAFRAVTGKEIVVPPFFSVTGAIGAAVCAAGSRESTRSRVNSGGKSGTVSYNQLLTENSSMKDRSPEKKTIGIPRVLFMYKLFPMFNAFFEALGYNVLLSGETDETLIAEAQSRNTGEACYPVKLVIGHVSTLLSQGVDMVFLPSLITMRHEGSLVRRDYACLMMQSVPHFIKSILDFDAAGTGLLTTRLNMDSGKKGMAAALFDIGRQLGISGPAIAAAAAKGAAAMLDFQKKLHARGRKWLGSVESRGPAFVIVSRPYGLHDPELNKGIPAIFADLGEKLISLTELPIEDYALKDHENMYWPFGQHILKGVEAVLERDDLHLVFLTNHGCGPDTILLHYVDEKMNGRPYLHIEIDEHASGEGVRTRIEAFVNSIRSPSVRKAQPARKKAPENMLKVMPPAGDLNLYIPPLYSGNAETMLFSSVSDSESRVRTKEDPALRALWAVVSSVLAQDDSITKLLLPVNEGSSPDGQYGRLIRLWLDQSNRPDVSIYSPFLEDLPDLPEDIFTVFAGNMVRADLQRRFVDLFGSYTDSDYLTLSLSELAERVRAAESSAETILVTGDPWIIADRDWILKDIIRPLRESGFAPLRMPISEMMLFFWTDRQKNNPNTEYLRQLTAQFSSSSIEVLQRKADEFLPGVMGGHLRYLIAKGFCESAGHAGIIHAAGLYDNGATILTKLGGDLWTSFPYKGPEEPADPEIIRHMLLKLENCREKITMH